MTSLLGPGEFLFPELSLPAQNFIRIAYGILLAGTLLSVLPHGRRFFLSERWGGYAQKGWTVEILHNPFAYPIVMAVWLSCAGAIALGWWATSAAFVNLLLCRYYFVHMCWKGILRGMGAPGFMTYWLALAVFLLEYTSRFAHLLRPLAVLALQADFAFIMLSAGIYKFTAGYPRNHGMELGLVNPEWGYWWKGYMKLPPNHWAIFTMNQIAWATEVIAGILMLIPQTRFLGGMLIVISFAFIATQIRLCLLTEMVMLGGVLFFHPGSLGDQGITYLLPPSPLSPVPASTGLIALNGLLEIALWGYLLLLPLAHGGLFYNFYGKKRLPGPLQRVLEKYTNFFGMIIWRVFSVDIVSFFIQIFRRPREGSGEEHLLTRFGWREGSLRYSHVAESITLTSIFTTLKYYPRNSSLFLERLSRYARTLPCPEDSLLVFRYMSLVKEKDRFVHLPAAEFLFDPVSQTVNEHILNPDIPIRSAHPDSPVVEGEKPGSYLPRETPE